MAHYHEEGKVNGHSDEEIEGQELPFMDQAEAKVTREGTL